MCLHTLALLKQKPKLKRKTKTHGSQLLSSRVFLSETLFCILVILSEILYLREISMKKQWTTVLDFIQHGKVTSKYQIVEVQGMNTVGDGGALTLVRTGAVGTPSQSFTDTGNNTCVDKNGDVWEVQTGSSVHYNGTDDWFGNGFGSQDAGGYQLTDGTWALSVDTDNLSRYTDIVYKATVDNSAFENMINDLIASPTKYPIGTLICTGGTVWIYNSTSLPISIGNFTPITEINIYDFSSEGVVNNSSIQESLDSGVGRVFHSGKDIDASGDPVTIPPFTTLDLGGATVNVSDNETFIYAGLDAPTTSSRNGITNAIIAGTGRDNGATGIHHEGSLNTAYVLFNNVQLASMKHGMNLSAGWSKVLLNCDIRGNQVGIKYSPSSITAGWEGSGNLMLAGALQYNDTGVDETGATPWCNTYINSIFEGNGTHIRSYGDNTIMINPWFEGHTTDQPMEWRRGIVLMGGRGVAWNEVDVDIFNSTEVITTIDKNGIFITHDGTNRTGATPKPVFVVNGKGVEKIKGRNVGTNSQDTRSSLHSSVISDTAPTGDFIKGYTLQTHGARYTARITNEWDIDADSAVTNVDLGLIRSSTDTVEGRASFTIKRYQTEGHANNTSNNVVNVNLESVAPGVTNAIDLGESGLVWRDIFAQNAVTIGSDERLKNLKGSISQELCDFALTVEHVFYELKSGQSGRDHVGIVVNQEFLENIGKIKSVSELAFLCNSVFTDGDGKAITKIMDITYNNVEEDSPYTYTVPDYCDIEVGSSKISIRGGVIQNGIGVLSNGVISLPELEEIDRDTQLTKWNEKRVEAQDDLDSAKASLKKKNSELEDLIKDSKSVKLILEAQKNIHEIEIRIENVLNLVNSLSESNFVFTPVSRIAKVGTGTSILGDVWQVRYEEFHGIQLEAMRRKLNTL